MATTVMAMDMVMAMEDMVMVTMDTMVRGQLKLNPAMDTMVMDMDMAMVTDTVMATTDTMERDLLKPNQDMDTMAMDMDMATDTMDTMARGLLNLAMDTMAMDMVMVMVMVMVMDTMDKSIFMLLPR